MIEFTVPGEPKGKKVDFHVIDSKKKSKKTGKNIYYVQPYNTPKTKVEMNKISMIARNAMRTPPIETPVLLGARFFFNIPKSWSQKKKDRAFAGTLRPPSKPDLSNAIKLLEDALTGIIWKDDCLVVQYLPYMGKYYSYEPRIEVEIVTLEELKEYNEIQKSLF